MRLARANKEAIRFACLHFHYAKSVPVNPLGYNVYNGKDEWCGVILYALGANPQIGTQYKLDSGEAVELVRVALNGKQECTSQAVAMSIRQLHRDCPLVKLIVSYADCDQNHLGTIYQATNWIYVGDGGKSETYFIINGRKTHRKSLFSTYGSSSVDAIMKAHPDAKVFHSQGKRKYLMPLDKKMKKMIEPLSKPYPKNDDWVKIDRNKFKHKEEDGREEEI